MPLHATDFRAKSFLDLQGQAVTLFVRPTGSDNNDGLTEQTPFLTLSRVMRELEKDFRNGSYTVDITGCTFDEPISFVQIRAETTLRTAYRGAVRDSYGAEYYSAVNFRARPTVILDLPAIVGGVHQEVARARLDYSAYVPNWVPGAYRGKFLDGGDGTRLIPIIDNGVDWIDYVEDTTYMADTGTQCVFARIVSNGAMIRASNANPVTLDGIVGGYTFFGIRFDRLNDEAFVIQNCQTLSFEGCDFYSSPWGRIRIGGSGIPRFYMCTFHYSSFRTTGARLMFQGCASPTGGTVLGWGNPDNPIGDVISGVNNEISVDRCWFGGLTYMNTGYYPGAHIRVSNSTIENIFSGTPFQHGELSIWSSNIGNLSVGFGGVARAMWSGIFTNPSVVKGGMLYLEGASIDGNVTVDGVVTDPTTLPPGFNTLRSSDGSAVCYYVAP